MKKRQVLMFVCFLLQLRPHWSFCADIDPEVTNSSMFVLSNLQAVSIKIQGASIVGGKSTLVNANTNDFYSQGNLMMTSTNIIGNIKIGAGFTMSASRFGSLTIVSSTLYDFQSIRNSLIETSNMLGQAVPNGTLIITPNEDLVLNGTDPDVNVFRVNNPDFYTSIKIDVPLKSTAIINIMGTNPFLWQTQFNSFHDTTQNADPSLVLFNFPQARSITLKNGTIFGTLLAPLATTSISSSKITGGVITNNLLIQNSNIQGDRFEGDLDPPIHTPEPRTFVLAVISILACLFYRSSFMNQSILTNGLELKS